MNPPKWLESGEGGQSRLSEGVSSRADNSEGIRLKDSAGGMVLRWREQQEQRPGGWTKLFAGPKGGHCSGMDWPREIMQGDELRELTRGMFRAEVGTFFLLGVRQ